MTIQVVGVLLVNLGRIAEHHRGQGAGRCGAPNRAGEALLDQIGQVAAVVNMGMAQQHPVNVPGTEGKVAVSLNRLSPRTLV
jgi:hypothetical protein